MKLKVINSVRTNNFKDDQILEKITGLWANASSQLNNEKITYGVYHDYESDYKGDYSLSIAIEEDTPASSLEIPDETKYEVSHVNSADEHGVINTWKEIWKREDSGTLARTYTYDFEKYLPNGAIEIYIAIK